MLGSDDISSFSKLCWYAVKFVGYGNINEALVLFHTAHHLAAQKSENNQRIHGVAMTTSW